MHRMFDESQPGRVLALGAHPDDMELGAGGLLARLASEGVDVTMGIISIPTRIDERTEEAQKGAAVIGGKLQILNSGHERRVEDIPMYELVAQLDALIAETRPDLVITHSENDLHWDHGLVNRATLAALRRTPCDLLSFLSSPEMNAQTRGYGQCFVDISPYIDAKIQAISCHTSQLRHLDVESSRDLARAMGRIGGFAYAETYEVLRVRF